MPNPGVKRETMTVPIIRAKFGEFVSIVELAAVLDGLDYLANLLLPAAPEGVVQRIIEATHEDEEHFVRYSPLGLISAKEFLTDFAASEEAFELLVEGPPFRLELTHISYNSPLELCAAMMTGAYAIQQVVKVAERLLGLVERWQDIRLKRARANQSDELSRQMGMKTRLMQEAADYIVDRLHMKPLDSDTRRLTNASRFLELVEEFEIVDEEKVS